MLHTVFRAYWHNAARFGPARATLDAAAEDGWEGSKGPYGVTLTVATEDPTVPGRTIDATTRQPIYPTHGMSDGSVRWPD